MTLKDYLWPAQLFNSGIQSTYYLIDFLSSFHSYNHYYYNNPLRVVQFHITFGGFPTTRFHTDQNEFSLIINLIICRF
jgi:hypothetical protein